MSVFDTIKGWFSGGDKIGPPVTQSRLDEILYGSSGARDTVTSGPAQWAQILGSYITPYGIDAPYIGPGPVVPTDMIDTGDRILPGSLDVGTLISYRDPAVDTFYYSNLMRSEYSQVPTTQPALADRVKDLVRRAVDPFSNPNGPQAPNYMAALPVALVGVGLLVLFAKK